MSNFLPAVSISSFVYLNTDASPRPKEYGLHEFFLNKDKKNHSAIAVAKKVTENKHSSAAGIRVVAVSLYNNTNEIIILKKNLRIQEENKPGEMVNFMPPALTKKQTTSVYFMYHLLHQRLPFPQLKSEYSSENNNPSEISNNKTNLTANRDIFICSTQSLDVIARLKEANLFYKSILPGQTSTGLLLCLSSSAAPLQFFLG